MTWARRLLRDARKNPTEAALVIVYLATCLYVIAAPLLASRYPAMTDLPFHAAQSSVIRHYFDDSYHFRDQFELHPLAVPYVTHYALTAFLMLFFSATTAIRLATGMLLALLPIGLSTLFMGMKKSPLFGIVGAGLIWCNLTHWGFINFVAALGLFAMALGLAMLVLDKPTRGRRVALALVLVLLFFTHVFRYPMTLVAVLGTGVLLYPATRRFRPILLPLLPSAALFVIWNFVRPPALAADLGPLKVATTRLSELSGLLFGGLADPAERVAVDDARTVLFLVGLVGGVATLLEAGYLRRRPREVAFAVGSTLVVVFSALGFLLLFLTLPMQMGDWWYVYPREATATVFIALALFPGLPKMKALRLPFFAALVAVIVPIATLVKGSYAAFGEETEDFYTITRQIPKAPKLLYLVFDHSGSSRSSTPFIHLPAYVQAEKGGWLSFHFAVWNASPVMYRDPSEPGAVVPPPVPKRWEWTPQRFEVRSHGPFFDWFLVRSKGGADRLFFNDNTIERVDHVGSWWLYRRKPGMAAPPIPKMPK